jgi:hypothetical protein
VARMVRRGRRFESVSGLPFFSCYEPVLVGSGGEGLMVKCPRDVHTVDTGLDSADAGRDARQQVPDTWTAARDRRRRMRLTHRRPRRYPPRLAIRLPEGDPPLHVMARRSTHPSREARRRDARQQTGRQLGQIARRRSMDRPDVQALRQVRSPLADRGGDAGTQGGSREGVATGPWTCR